MIFCWTALEQSSVQLPQVYWWKAKSRIEVTVLPPARLHQWSAAGVSSFPAPAGRPMPAGAESPACPSRQFPSCASRSSSVRCRWRTHIPAASGFLRNRHFRCLRLLKNLLRFLNHRYLLKTKEVILWMIFISELKFLTFGWFWPTWIDVFNFSFCPQRSLLETFARKNRFFDASLRED